MRCYNTEPYLTYPTHPNWGMSVAKWHTHGEIFTGHMRRMLRTVRLLFTMLYILWRILMYRIQPSKHEKYQFIENVDRTNKNFKGSINGDKYGIVYSTIRYIYRTYGFIFLRNYIFLHFIQIIEFKENSQSWIECRVQLLTRNHQLVKYFNVTCKLSRCLRVTKCTTAIVNSLGV